MYWQDFKPITTIWLSAFNGAAHVPCWIFNITKRETIFITDIKSVDLKKEMVEYFVHEDWFSSCTIPF